MSLSTRSARVGAISYRRLCIGLSHKGLHTKPRLSATTAASRSNPQTSDVAKEDEPEQRPIGETRGDALSPLSTGTVLRTYLITSLSSSPVLMNSSMSILRAMLRARSFLFNIDRNPVLNWLFKKTIYAQFSAGENRQEVKETVEVLKRVGYDGITLQYSAEIVGDAIVSRSATEITEDIIEWRTGMLESISMCETGSFVAMKYTGMGPEALRMLKEGRDPPPEMQQALKDICDAAADKGVSLLPSAEQQNVNHTIDSWNLALARQYNTLENGRAIIYHTYQCYLKAAPALLVKHLQQAAENNFILGIKLVRGAYMDSEPERDLIWGTKAETDSAYDGLTAALIKNEPERLSQLSGLKFDAMPPVELQLATHNLVSVQRASALLRAPRYNRTFPKRITFSQLQGMADEVSGEIIQARRASPSSEDGKIYKYSTWGTTKQCLEYLYRRAEENNQALERTATTQKAMRQELWKRFAKTFSFF